jgi:hypothetical protein
MVLYNQFREVKDVMIGEYDLDEVQKFQEKGYTYVERETAERMRKELGKRKNRCGLSAILGSPKGF